MAKPSKNQQTTEQLQEVSNAKPANGTFYTYNRKGNEASISQVTIADGVVTNEVTVSPADIPKIAIAKFLRHLTILEQRGK